MIEEKHVILAVRADDERRIISQLLADFPVRVFHAQAGREVVWNVEDHGCDCLISDAHLSDMHVWSVLRAVNEVSPDLHFSVIILSDEDLLLPTQAITTLVRPLAVVRLKSALRDALL